MFVCLNDLIDTLKLQFYCSDVEKDKLHFNLHVSHYMDLKNEAMTIKSDDPDRKITRLNSSHLPGSRMPSSA